MNEVEKAQAQEGVDRIYLQFKQRVAEGRKKDINYIDSIAQGRVWSGTDAISLGLVDRIGNLDDAIRSAASLAKMGGDYGVKEYPESKGWLNTLLDRKKDEPSALIREKLGEQQYRVYRELVRINEMTNSVQARLPFEIYIHGR
jgi:protease-4